MTGPRPWRQAVAGARRLTTRGRQGLRRRLRQRVGRPDEGRAIVEFIVVGVLVLLPVTYLVMTLARVQAAAFAVSTASREAGRAYTTTGSGQSAEARGRAAAALAFEDFDFGPSGSVTFACDGSPCLRPEGRVQIEASVRVRLPLLPDFLQGSLPTEIPVSAAHVATVDRFRGQSGVGR